MSEEPTQQPTNDDQTLTNVLSGANDQVVTMNNEESIKNDLQFEDTPRTVNQHPSEPDTDDDLADDDEEEDESVKVTVASAPVAPDFPNISPANNDLESIKKDALSELRPLVEKLNLPADEKFDIMLLIIRSTDDHSLVASAHVAAKSIEDETKRAQALLDIVKEIDYFAGQTPA